MSSEASDIRIKGNRKDPRTEQGWLAGWLSSSHRVTLGKSLTFLRLYWICIHNEDYDDVQFPALL